MPLALTRGDRNLLLSGGGIFVLIVAVTVGLMSGESDTSDTPTRYSTGSAGAKAAYRLLPALGYRVERWIQEPAALTDAATTTLILAQPAEAPTPAEQQAITRFLAGGGRVIATGFSGSLFLGGAATPNPINGLTWSRARAVVPSSITRAAPEITLAPQSSWRLGFPALVLYQIDEAPVVVQTPTTEGQAFWWAAATPLTNAGLREPGNLELFLACLGPPDGRRVLFDEYFHGVRASLGAAVLRTPAKWILIQLAAVAALILWTHSRRSGPIVRPAPESRLSPLEFVRTLGSLYQRAGAASVPVDAAYRRVRFWLTRRLGVSADTPPESIERAVRDRWGLADQGVTETLRVCEAARHDESLTPRAALTHVQALAALSAALHLFGPTDKETG
jgi:hypothetical protein